MLALLIMAGISLAPKPVLAAAGCCVCNGTQGADPCNTDNGNSDCAAPICLSSTPGTCVTSTAPCSASPAGSGTASGATTPAPGAGSLTNPLSGACGSIDQKAPDAGQKCVQLIIGNVIKAALGIVGSIALLMMTYGGFLWLTAMGNNERVEKGKETLIWAVLGLVVIFGAYAITSYIIDKIVAGK